MKTIAVTILILASVVLTGCTKDVDADRMAAFSACETFVVGRLKAPATAKFAPITDANATVTESFIYTSDEKNAPYTIDQYTVTSYVDAQNSFSAMLRNHYVCKVQHAGSGPWKLMDLDIQ